MSPKIKHDRAYVARGAGADDHHQGHGYAADDAGCGAGRLQRLHRWFAVGTPVQPREFGVVGRVAF